MSQQPDFLLEICCDSVASALTAAANGADRIELCENLAQGGVTPSFGKVQLALELVDVPVFVLVRPRKADFLYTETEFQTMLYDIQHLKALGVQGIVSGVLLPDGQIDQRRTRQLIEAAHPLPFTFHRAFDMCLSPTDAIEQLIELGVQRILSSGAAPTALEGKRNLTTFAGQAAGRISIIACGELLPENIGAIAAIAGVQELHSAARRQVNSAMEFRGAVNMGDEQVEEEFSWMEVDGSLVSGMKAILQSQTV